MRYNKTFLTTIILYFILGCCMVSALAIFYLASRGDTTLLGDPYYEDKILAPERAFIPWLATMITVTLAAVLGVLTYRRK